MVMPAKPQSGFTLLELMITISVAAILAVIAYPNMRNFFLRNNVVAESNSLQASLQYARGQAAATRSYVSICPLAPASGSTVNTVCDTGTGNYQYGWLVYTAASANSAYDSATSTLQSAVGAPSNMSVNADQTGVLSYSALGELVKGGQPVSATFKTCADASAGDALGVSTTAVPGIQLSAADSGRIASTQLAAGAACN